MKILYFGTYSRDYIRNRVIIRGLKENGVDVVECHYALWRGVEPRINEFKGLKGLIRLSFNFFKAYIILTFKIFSTTSKPDFIIVGYTGHFDIPLAFIVSKILRRPLAFDFHVSLWDTFVMDRKIIKKGSLFEKILRGIDRTSLILPDIIFLDTSSHIEFVSNEFKINKGKFRRFWVGEEDDFFYPVKTEKFKEFTVIQFGGFIPLHGTEYIIEAARILKDEKIKFLLVGKGQCFKEIRELSSGLKNVEFTGWVEPEKLPELISKCHISLGIFGDTDKARRVIPNKIYESIACKIPVITGDTPAIREVFTHKKDIYLCKMMDGKSIADAIITLKNDERLREKIASNGYKLFLEKFTPFKIGKDVIEELKNFKGGNYD